LEEATTHFKFLKHHATYRRYLTTLDAYVTSESYNFMRNYSRFFQVTSSWA